MSRIPKYRVWDKDEKRMDYNVGLVGNRILFEYGDIEPHDGYIEAINYVDIDEDNEKYFEIMESIGLKDRIVRKNRSEAKEIYRCDIIKALNRNYDCEDNREDCFQLFEVTYLNGCYMFGNWNAHEFFNRFMHIEVVGNKFENPELLEK